MWCLIAAVEGLGLPGSSFCSDLVKLKGKQIALPHEVFLFHAGTYEQTQHWAPMSEERRKDLQAMVLNCESIALLSLKG